MDLRSLFILFFEFFFNKKENLKPLIVTYRPTQAGQRRQDASIATLDNVVALSRSNAKQTSFLKANARGRIGLNQGLNLRFKNSLYLRRAARDDPFHG